MKLDELLDEKTINKLFPYFYQRTHKVEEGHYALYLFKKGMVREEHIPYVCEYLKRNPAIIALNLSHNNIGPGGAIFFAKNNQTITMLTCIDSKIGDDGCDALITHHKYLTHLEASENKIGDRGVANIHLNTTLTSLHLDHNSITDEGAVSLSRNATITFLVLNANKIGKLGASALENNQNLRCVDISYQRSEKPPSYTREYRLSNLSSINDSLKEDYLEGVKWILSEWILPDLARIIFQYKEKDIVPIYYESIQNRIIAQLPRPAEQGDTQFNKDLKTAEAESKTTEKLLSKLSLSDGPSPVSSNSQTFINSLPETLGVASGTKLTLNHNLK